MLVCLFGMDSSSQLENEQLLGLNICFESMLEAQQPEPFLLCFVGDRLEIHVFTKDVCWPSPLSARPSLLWSLAVIANQELGSAVADILRDPSQDGVITPDLFLQPLLQAL